MNRPASQSGGSGGGSPGVRGGLLLIVAVVLGIYLLQAFDTGFDLGPGLDVDSGTDTTLPELGSSTTLPSTPGEATTTTAPARNPSAVSVLVANGTEILGLAGRQSEDLQAAGYNTLTPTDATVDLETSSVQYVGDYLGDAQAVALTLGIDLGAVQPADAPPVPDAAGANVIVLLGVDAPGAATSSTPAA